MDSRQLIDAQFDRAVEIVQSLPKNGPIQTDYEEKLTILYKQATVGNVTSTRPGIWDMLGRAKWDAWAKHKDLDKYEAKWLYVDALMKVLKKYPERTIAKDLLKELEAFEGDPNNILLSTLSRHSDSSNSSGSEPENPPYTSHIHGGQSSQRLYPNQPQVQGPEDEETDSEQEREERDGHFRGDTTSPYTDPTPRQRPLSSLSAMSGNRYRTPMGSVLTSPPPSNYSVRSVHALHGVPSQQPMPSYETQSAFDDAATVNNENFNVATTSYPAHLAHSSRNSDSGYGHRVQDPRMTSDPVHRRSGSAVHSAPTQGQLRPGSRLTLERAVENVQSHLAALSERLETLEVSRSSIRTRVAASPRDSNSPNRFGSSSSSGELVFDLDDMGLWSLVLQPFAKLLASVRGVAAFLAVNENRSPTFVVIRRLFLDLSFVLAVLAVAKVGWRRTGLRRKEIYIALGVLWKAVIGGRTGRVRRMVEQGV
ncbi:ACBP-domain-containing protein [Thelephora ganbajun]|uniref:ACBP-domain-containing protein n=1 Tax=Thelephora ganbajun TaxID=370292 RepID=A0ACB6ZR91_THEGA|nr:ACBP-domain-containing protein [Thelephora ganbajun]